MGCASYSSRDLGLAFACTIGAGLASVLGALIVLFFNVRNNLFLAAAVSFASGVMIYISFCDIYIGKAVGHFADAGSSGATAFLFATICFFCGMPIAVGLDYFGDWIIKRNKGGSAELPITAACGCHAESVPPPLAREGSNASSPSESAGVELATKSPQPHNHATDVAQPGPGDASTVVVVTPDNAKAEAEARRALKLVKVGLLAALAVGFHNAPEGLVTFVSYLNSISAGVTTAIAIAIHNIPEGMVVAVPIYYCTGSRVKALLWASLAAATEPLGALVGLAVACGGSLTDQVFGILFGLVAGIMVYVSIKELTPTARLYDPEDRVCTLAFVGGLLVMAASLVALQYT